MNNDPPLDGTSDRLDRRQSRIDEIVFDHVQRRLDGEGESVESLISRHPDLMPELEEQVRLLAELSDESASNVELPSRGKRSSSRTLTIRCPHCHQPVEVLADNPFTDITCSGCGSHFSLAGDAAETHTEREFKKLGHFHLIERLGVGSFGTVWKARDTELDRTVAVKIPRRGKLEPSEVESFLREARAAAQLNHPNIVSVHEVGREEDTIFIVSDLVRGVSLSDWLTAQRPTFREAAELCATIASALHHAHEAGVIHRDLKPQNVMLDGESQPHLMDFGLARRDMGEITMTLDGHVLGTPAYMSPEQARGEAHQADRRTDVYSLGVILFELLTGELPFRGNARILIHQVLNEDAPSPRKLDSSVPRDLETICLKCVEKEPHKRFNTAHDVAEELRRYLAGEPIQARPISAVNRGWRWCKRYPVAAALAVLVLAVAVIGPAIAVSQHRLREAESQARRDAEETRDNFRWLLYCSDMSVANQAWHGGDIDKVRQRLYRHVPNDQQSDLRGFGWYYLWQLCRKSFVTPDYELGKHYRHHLYWTLKLDYTRDGGALVLHRGRMGDAEAYDLLTGRVGQPLDTLSLPTGTRRFWYFPKGERFVEWHERGVLSLRTGINRQYQHIPVPEQFSSIELLDVSKSGNIFALTGELKNEGTQEVHLGEIRSDVNWRTFDLGTHVPRDLSISPDSRYLAVMGKEQNVQVWNIEDGQLRYTIPQPGPDPFCAFSPDGRLLITWSNQNKGELKIWSVENGKLSAALNGHTARVHTASLSNDGKTLASAGLDRRVILWDVAKRKALHPPLVGHTNWIGITAFSPDGMTLASAGIDCKVILWDVGTGKRWDTLHGHSTGVDMLAFSPDGRRLSSADSTGVVRIWDLPKRPISNAIKASDKPIDALVLSPDSKTVAVAARGEPVKLWDLETGELRHQLVGHTQSTYPALPVLSFLPGEKLAVADASYVKFWDVQTGVLEDKLELEETHLHKNVNFCSVACSSDGRWLAGGRSDGKVSVWDRARRRLHSVLTMGDYLIREIAFSPDGNRIAATDIQTATVWDLDQNRKLFRTAREPLTLAVRFLSNDKLVLSRRTGVALLRAADGKELSRFRAHSTSVMSVARLPGTEQLVSVGMDRLVKVWDLPRNSERFTFHDHTSAVLALSCSADGQTFVSGDDDGYVRIWRAATAQDVSSIDW